MTTRPADGLSTLESGDRADSVVDARAARRRLRSAVLAVAACAFTFVIGAALGISGDPAHLALGAVIGLLTFAGAVAAPRVALVVATFLLVAYVADAAPGVAGRVAVSGTIGVLLAATLLRVRVDGTAIRIPGDAGWILLYVAAFLIVTVAAEDRSAAIKPFFDLVGYGALAILLLALMDDEQWVRRFAWAITSALGLLASLAVYQQLSHSFDTDFGGLARVEFDGGLTRSGGPISANYFGQVLAAGCVLAAYLALAARSRRERVLALLIVGVSAVALVYTFSRGAMIALVAAALLAATLRHVRPVLIVLVAVGTVFAAMFLLPPQVSERVRELGQLASPTAGTDPSLRGRTSENLAAIEMWRATSDRRRGTGQLRAAIPRLLREDRHRRACRGPQRAQSVPRGVGRDGADRGDSSVRPHLRRVATPMAGAPSPDRRRAAPGRGFLRRARCVSRERCDTAQHVPALPVGVPRSRSRREGSAVRYPNDRRGGVLGRVGGDRLGVRGISGGAGDRRTFPTEPPSARPLEVPVSVVVAAHNEDAIIASKVENLLYATYPAPLLEVVVASDGSNDRTVERARDAGAHLVIDLPRVGKLQALNEAVERTSGEILVFSDADALLPPETLRELVSNFADPRVGAVAANEVHVANDPNGVARGESLYWRYEQKIKALEDKVGNTVSASGRLYAMRRSLFTPSTNTAAADDVALSTEVIPAGRRLAFDVNARVFVFAPAEGGTELMRKVRMMNQGLRATFALMARLSLRRHSPYVAQLMLHKVLRRFVGFLLLALLVASAAGVAYDGGWIWRLALALQLWFYVLAILGAVLDRAGRKVPRVLWIPYYFCLSNLAAALAVLTLVRGTRFEMWEPASDRGSGSRQSRRGTIA